MYGIYNKLKKFKMVFFDSTKKIHISQNKKFQDNRRATFKKNTFFFLKHFF